MDEFEMLPAAVPFMTMDAMTGKQTFAKQNEGVTAIFFHAPVQNPAKTEAEGRPIFDEFEFCRILIAGDVHNAHVEPVSPATIKRFPIEYAEWKAGNDRRAHVSGTPLKQWPLMNPAKIAEFEALNIYSVEALAGLADVHLQHSFDLRDWRAKAQAYLEASKDGSVVARYASENEKLRARVAQLEGHVADLTEQTSRLMNQPPPPPPNPAPVLELQSQMAQLMEQMAALTAAAKKDDVRPRR